MSLDPDSIVALVDPAGERLECVLLHEDDGWLSVVPLRDSWPEPELIAFRSTAVRGVGRLAPDELAVVVSPRWPEIARPTFVSVADGFEWALANGRLIALTDVEDPDSIEVGFVRSWTADELELESVDPSGRLDDVVVLDLHEAAAITFWCQYLSVLEAALEIRSSD